MKYATVVFAFVGLGVLVSGCAATTGSNRLSPTEGPIVRTSSEFDDMAKDVTAHEGERVKLAGRVQRVESQDDGYRVLAKWLPYPAAKMFDEGPKDIPSEDARHFIVKYRGKVRQNFSLVKGNTFIINGNIEGTRETVISVVGRKANLLLVNADCVRIWETGQSPVATSPDSQFLDSYFSHTFCVSESK